MEQGRLRGVRPLYETTIRDLCSLIRLTLSNFFRLMINDRYLDIMLTATDRSNQLKYCFHMFMLRPNFFKTIVEVN